MSKRAGIFDANSWNLQFMEVVLQFFEKAAGILVFAYPCLPGLKLLKRTPVYWLN